MKKALKPRSLKRARRRKRNNTCHGSARIHSDQRKRFVLSGMIGENPWRKVCLFCGRRFVRREADRWSWQSRESNISSRRITWVFWRLIASPEIWGGSPKPAVPGVDGANGNRRSMVLLAKPETFMNLSGISVQGLCRTTKRAGIRSDRDSGRAGFSAGHAADARGAARRGTTGSSRSSVRWGRRISCESGLALRPSVRWETAQDYLALCRCGRRNSRVLDTVHRRMPQVR